MSRQINGLAQGLVKTASMTSRHTSVIFQYGGRMFFVMRQSK